MIGLFVCAAGGIGALSRFITDGLIRSRFGRVFPWGTIFINVSGALLLGIVTGLTLHHGMPLKYKLIIGTGFCGGYTTFSTASFEAVRLLEEKRFWSALMHVAANAGLTILAATAALTILR